MTNVKRKTEEQPVDEKNKSVELQISWKKNCLPCSLPDVQSTHAPDRAAHPANRSRIHEQTISLRFLGIILGGLRVEVSVWIFLNHRERGMVFYQVFLLSPLQVQ